MVERYRKEKTPDSSTVALWQFYQQSSLVAKQEDAGEGNAEFLLTKYLFHTLQGSLTCWKFLHETDGFTSSPKKSCHGFLYFIYLFMCSLFNGFLSSWDYISSNEMMIGELWIGKHM
jgi:hypothetical protein